MPAVHVVLVFVRRIVFIAISSCFAGDFFFSGICFLMNLLGGFVFSGSRFFMSGFENILVTIFSVTQWENVSLGQLVGVK